MKRGFQSVENKMIFIVGCPRSGTTWMGKIFQQYPRVLYSKESAILDIFTGGWWEQADWSEVSAPTAKVVQILGASVYKIQSFSRDRLLDLAEAVLGGRKPHWYAAWRENLVTFFASRWVFILRHGKRSQKDTPMSDYRARVIDFESLVEVIDEVESDADSSREEKVHRVAHGIFQHFLRRHQGTSDHILVEKSPRHVFTAEFILEHFPQAKIIEMLRDGRDVCVSMQSYKERMPQQRPVQVFFWKNFVQKGLELKENEAYRDRILTVRFEDLKRDTAAEIRRVFDFSGLETSAGQVEEIVRATHISKMKVTEGEDQVGEGKHYRKGVVGDWRERFTAQDEKWFREKAGDVFIRAGYEWQ